MLDLSQFDLEEIATGLSEQDEYGNAWLMNAETGEILYWTSDGGFDGNTPVDLDEVDLDLIRIQPLPSYVWYQDMVDFAELVSDERFGGRLARALEGRGAFRRFKDELHRLPPELLTAWYAFRDNRSNRRAVEWLSDNSLIDDDAAEQFRKDHPDPAVP
jgi:hypothetical protein